MRVIIVPYIEKHTPGGLKKGEREALVTYDLPKIHSLPAWFLAEMLEKGIHILAFPHNATAWAQPLDNRHAFGAFKSAYYDEVDGYLRDLQEQQVDENVNISKIPTHVVLMLIKKAWEKMSPKRVLAAFRGCGLVIGQSEAMKQLRKDAIAKVISEAHDAPHQFNKKKEKKKQKTSLMSWTPSPRSHLRNLQLLEKNRDSVDTFNADAKVETITLRVPRGTLVNCKANIAEQKRIEEKEKKEEVAKVDRLCEDISNKRTRLSDGYDAVYQHFLSSLPDQRPNGLQQLLETCENTFSAHKTNAMRLHPDSWFRNPKLTIKKKKKPDMHSIEEHNQQFWDYLEGAVRDVIPSFEIKIKKKRKIDEIEQAPVPSSGAKKKSKKSKKVSKTGKNSKKKPNRKRKIAEVDPAAVNDVQPVHKHATRSRKKKKN